MSLRGRQINLVRVPNGEPVEADMELVEVDVPSPAAGQLLVRNTWMSVEPAMRIRMGGGGATIPKVPNYELGKPLDGMAIGEVLESTVEGYAPGDLVVHGLGWRDYGLPEPSNPAHRVYRIPRGEGIPEQTYLGALSLVGFTAHVGLFPVANLQKDDVVWVSAAAGAVGTMACQVAKMNGNKVIASAGTPEKVAYLKDVIGVDEAFDYHDGPVLELLEKAAPEGIDVYFDMVGGDHLAAALEVLRPKGRVALCGLISTYNSTEPVPGPSNMFSMIAKNITIKGFLAVQYLEHMEPFRDQVRRWIADGRLDYRETVVHGLPAAPAALIDTFNSRSMGKMLVDLR
jgi:NADPH-dependent curcumin reductase CurA